MRLLAEILVRPLVLYSFLAFLGLLAFVPGTFALIGTRRLCGALKQGRDILTSVADAAGFAARYEQLNAKLEQINIIGSRWRDFRETLLLPTIPNRPVRATEAPEHWFNQSALTESVVNQRWHSALPGILVGAGLLFTFLGLAAALSTAGGIVAEGIGQTERNVALRNLLDTASFKFLTSLTGLFLSIAYTILWKAVCQRRIDRALDGFLLALEMRIVLRTAIAAQDDVIALLEKQVEQAETFTNTLAVSIGSALDSALDQRLGDHIGPLARAVEQLSEKMATQNQDAVAGMLDEFLKKLNTNAGDSLKQAADKLADLGTNLAGLKETLNGAAELMKTAAEGMSTRMGESAEQALSRVTQQFQRMIEELTRLGSETRATGATALDQLSERIAAAAAGFESSAQRVADALSRSASETGASLGKGAEDAVKRIALATEGMRNDLQAMMAEFRSVLGSAGNALQRGGEQGATALTDALGDAGQTLADAVRVAASSLQTAGETASVALQRGGESAGVRLDQSAGEIGMRATALAREAGTLAASLAALPGRINELEQAAGRAAPPLTAGAADLRAAAEAARLAVAPLQDTARSITVSAEQVTVASRQLESVQASSRDLAQAMIGAAQRFEGVDRELATVTRDLQDGLRGFAQQINELVKATNADLSKAVTHLDGAIRQLDETLEDRVPRPVAARGGS